MKTDYPELEGKEIEIITGKNTVKAIVVGVSYHIGITAVGKHDSIKYICLNNRIKMNLGKLSYRQVFHDFVKRIKSGKFDCYEVDLKLYGSSQYGVGNQDCAFI